MALQPRRDILSHRAGREGRCLVARGRPGLHPVRMFSHPPPPKHTRPTKGAALRVGSAPRGVSDGRVPNKSAGILTRVRRMEAAMLLI